MRGSRCKDRGYVNGQLGKESPFPSALIKLLLEDPHSNP